MATDNVEATLAEVRQFITDMRAMHPAHSDLEIALALLRRSNVAGVPPREATMAGLAATVLHFAAKHVEPSL